MKKITTWVAIFLVTGSISCNIQNECTRNIPSINFDTNSESFIASSNSETTNNIDVNIAQSLNNVLAVTPSLHKILVEDNGYTEFIEKLKQFKQDYIQSWDKMYPDADCIQFYTSFTVGYVISNDIILNDIVNVDIQESIEKHTGLSFEEYVLFNGFWASYLCDYCNLSKDTIPVSTENNTIDSPVSAYDICITQILIQDIFIQTDTTLKDLNKVNIPLLKQYNFKYRKNPTQFEQTGMHAQLLNMRVAEVATEVVTNIVYGDIIYAITWFLWNTGNETKLGATATGATIVSIANTIVGGNYDHDTEDFIAWLGKRYK